MRDESISVVKGFGIMFMVLGHTFFWNYGYRLIYLFHMPLFFFFAGYCLKSKYVDEPLTFKSLFAFCLKRIKGLYKPFVKWNIVFLLLHNLFFHLNIYNDEYGFKGVVSELYSLEDISQKLFKIIFQMSDYEQLLGGYWFLRSLLFCSIIGFIVIKISRKRLVMGFFLVFLLTIVETKLYNCVPYWSFTTDIFATVFFLSGYIYKKYKNFNIKWWTIGIFIFILIIGERYWFSEMISVTFITIVPYYFSAICGTLLCFYFSKMIVNHTYRLRRLLVYIGENTLTILTWHFLSFKLVSLIIIKIKGYRIEHLSEFPVLINDSQEGWFILYFIIGIFIPLVFSRIKYLK